MTPDTSVIVAAFSPWHAAHEQAVEAIRDVDVLVAHAELEAYSVLTRLKPPHRVSAALAAEYLRRQYRGPRVVMGGRGRARLVTQMAERAIAGGAVYDALIALTASEHGLTLLTRDTRAARTYQAAGVSFTTV